MGQLHAARWLHAILLPSRQVLQRLTIGEETHHEKQWTPQYDSAVVEALPPVLSSHPTTDDSLYSRLTHGR